MLDRKLLKPYQLAGVDFIKQNPFSALWVKMGLGKTVTTLTAIIDLFRSIEVKKVLIIAPKRVALHTWPSEIKNWSHLTHLTYTVLCGLKLSDRKKALRECTDIHIINRENVMWLVQNLGEHWDYDMVVIDESSSFKNHASKRFKSLKLMLPKITRMVQLTGTPSPNGLLDVWAPIFLLDKGERLGRNITAYRKKYFYLTGGYFKWILKSKFHGESIYNNLSDICYTIKGDGKLGLPEVITNRIEVELPPEVKKAYKELERDYVLELDDGEKVSAVFAAALQNKLLQYCNGAVYTDDEGNYSEIHDAKLEVLDEILEEAEGEPVLCAYNYRSDMERIKKRYGKNCTILDDKPETIDKWNRGEIPFLICHPASAGHGLNLQHGGNILVWYGLNWNLEYYLQFNARLARPGQKKDQVIMHQISTKGTIENKVFKALTDKNLTQEELLDFMKRPI